MSIFIDDISRDLRNAFAPFLKVNNSGGLELKGVPIPSEAEFLQQYKPTFIESYFLDFLVYRASLIKKKERAYEYGFTLLGPILDELKKSMAGKPFIVTIFRKNRDDDAQRKLTSISYLRLREALVDKGIPYVDGEEVFQREYIRYGQNESIFFVKKAHFNELGNAVFAHAIKNKLEELSIINKIKLCYSFLGEYVFSDEGPFLTNLSCLNETKTTEWQVANYDVLSIEPFACSAREMILGIC